MIHMTLATARMRAEACLVALVALAACGGGGGSVGSGGTGAPIGVAVGTVNGFGSVIVDGVHYDDRRAAHVAEDSPGHDAITEVKLGHRVEIELGDDGAVQTLHVEAGLKGPVASVPAQSQLVVLGQTVLVNSDATRGPVTQFGGGYTALADVRANDLVEVHGILVPQAQATVVQATRIDKQTAVPFLRVTGVVSNLAGSTFRLGTLTVTTSGSTAILPAGAALANGQVVRVMAPSGALAGGTTLAAAQVRIKTLPHEGNAAQVSGAIAALDTTARTFRIGEQTVSYGAAAVTPAGTTLANGQYVRVRGQLAADGTLTATDVVVRGHDANEAEAELHGNVADLNPTARTFSVRGVTVDFSRVTPGCTLANGTFVEVEGTLSNTTVVATRVQCENEPAGGVVERSGTATQVSTGARTFVLTPATGGTLTVTWSDLTFFSDVTPDTLQGQRVEVEGVLTGTTLAASKVKLDR